jgi:hypothetical protein
VQRNRLHKSTNRKGALMFYVSGLVPYGPLAPRRVYDNPPVITTVSRWPRLGRLASSAASRAAHGKPQARTTSPAASGSCS